MMGEYQWHEEWYDLSKKGQSTVAKQVKLVVGEGADKVDVGTAHIEKLPNGDAMVKLEISNQALVKLLGGSQVQGIIPSFVEAEEADPNG